MHRIIVTGASGFVGQQALVPLAERGFQVHAVCRGTAPAHLRNLGNVTWHSADLLDGATTQQLLARLRPTHLLHLAWYVPPGKFWNASENLDWTAATLGLMRSFKEAGGERLVSAGTCAEYDWSYGLLDETTTPLAPSNLYGVAKKALGSIQQSWAKEVNLSAAWGRIFFVFGPHEPLARLVSSVTHSLLSGKEALTSSGEQVRDFLSTVQLGQAFAALVDSNVSGSVNLASGRGVEIRQLVSTLAELTGRPDLLKLGAMASRPGEPRELVAAVDRLTNEVGWQPGKTLEEELQQTIDWWQDAGVSYAEPQPS